MIGGFDVDLFREFFQGLVNHAGMTLHIDNLRGDNAHHQAETVFKAFGRALRMAVEPDPRMPAAPCRRRRARCDETSRARGVRECRPAFFELPLSRATRVHPSDRIRADHGAPKTSNFMLLIPAIDLKDGKCVRLRQGRMDDETVFSTTRWRWPVAGSMPARAGCIWST
jgi:hypothetical protein